MTSEVLAKKKKTTITTGNLPETNSGIRKIHYFLIRGRKDDVH